MGLFGGHGSVPRGVRAALELRRGERVMAAARDQRSRDLIVATTTGVCVVGDGDGGSPPTVRSRRPWHEVSAGAWEPLTQTISVTWVDGGRAAQWTLADSADRGEAFATAFYERVATSVLIDAPIEIEGRPLGRVAIRRDLLSGDLIQQVTWARGSRRDDAHALAYAQVLLDDLAEQVGLE